MKRVIIIGAGPAGLTAAYELLRDPGEYRVTVLEASSRVGGIACTVCWHGNRMDMGGHRFFSKVPKVNAWWDQMLPRQGAPARDDSILQRAVTICPGGPDPEKTDRVMLRRKRLSRIFYNGKFFDYPVSIKPETFRNLGVRTSVAVGLSYLKASLNKRPEKSLEDFYINRFGKKLYSMFFEHYTENLWGRHPSQIDPSWGAQRVKGVSVWEVLKDALRKNKPDKNDDEVETSLIQEFSYPKLGPGQLWEITAKEVQKHGGEVILGSRVSSIRLGEGHRAVEVICIRDGHEQRIPADYVISSMPLRDLVQGMDHVPDDIATIAAGLPYRDFITVGILLSQLKLKNTSDVRTVENIVPDDWIYVHDRSVKVGRIQIFNNWSPYLVQDFKHTVWLGLEYFCSEGDSLWSMTDEAIARLAVSELTRLNIADSSDVFDSHVERVRKAYPAYFDTYKEIDKLRAFLDTIPNLFCVGRNGQHRYNNIDHSMCTAFEAVRDIRSATSDHSNVWRVNTEQVYHEKVPKGSRIP